MIETGFKPIRYSKNWIEHLKHANGNINLAAIYVLSQIMDNYYVRDDGDDYSFFEYKGQPLTRYNYKDFNGLTKAQAFYACHFLQEKGLIDFEVRPLETPNGVIPKKLFITPNFKKIQEIS